MTDKSKPRVSPEGSAKMQGALPDLPDLPDTEIAQRARRSGGPYIPGYSEEEAARDIEQAERFASAGEIHGLTDAQKQEYYERFGTGPKEKDFDLKFLRVAGPNGQANLNVRQRMVAHQRDGYQQVTVEDFEEGGIFADYDVPPDADVAPDGSIRRIDTALFYKPVDADEDDETPRPASPLDQIPEDMRIREEDKEGSKAATYPKL